MTALNINQNEFNLKCEQLWRDVFIAYTNSSNSGYKDQASKWADRAVEDYKKSFCVAKDSYEN